MRKRINIVRPDETISGLDQVTPTGKRSEFISRAVLHYIETQGRQSIRRNLEIGCRTNAERDLSTAAAWFPLEEEVAKTGTRSQLVKKVATAKHK